MADNSSEGGTPQSSLSIPSGFAIVEVKQQSVPKKEKATVMLPTVSTISLEMLKAIKSGVSVKAASPSKSPSKKASPVKKKVQKSPKPLPPMTLPQSRVRIIMKTAPNVSFLSQEAVALTGRATELFIKKLTKMTYEEAHLTHVGLLKDIQYNHLANATKNLSALGFLKDFLPQKITVKEHQQKQQLLHQQSTTTNSSSCKKNSNTEEHSQHITSRTDAGPLMTSPLTNSRETVTNSTGSDQSSEINSHPSAPLPSNTPIIIT